MPQHPRPAARLARLARLTIVTAAAAAMAGCADTDSTGVPAEPTPTRLTLRASPGAASVLVGATTQLTAEVHDAHGRRMRSVIVAWRSLDPEVADVSRGLATGTTAGTARVVASVGEASDTVLVAVTADPTAPGVIASLTLSPATLSLHEGATAPLAAVARDAHGTLVAGASVSWKSTDPAVASVSATGVVAGAGKGAARVIATASGHADTVDVTVTQVPVASVIVTAPFGTLVRGGTGQLAVTVRDASGEPLAGRETTFQTSSPAVATVSATGLVTAVGAGNATITATSGGRSGTVVVRVTAPEIVVGSVVVSPTAATLQKGETRQLAAAVRDSGGVLLADHPVGWTSANAAVATVSASGLVTAVGAGSTTVTAASGGKSAAVAVTVTAAPSPPPPPAPSVPVDVEAPLTAVGTVAQYDGAQFYLPDVMVAGDDDSTGVAPMQAFVTYSLAGVPAGAPLERARLTVVMHPNGVFGDPFALGPLVVERVTMIALGTGAPAASAVTVATALGSSVTVDVTDLVRAEREAGGSDVTLRLRFTSARDADGATDQLELTAGALEIRYLK